MCSKYRASTIFSVVVFVGDNIFKTAMPDNVVYAGGYVRYIKNKTQLVLTESEAKDIFSQIVTVD